MSYNNKDCILSVYKKYNIEFTKGDGSYLYDSNNKKYLDFFSVYATTSLGHNSSVVKNAIYEQLETGVILLSGHSYHVQSTIDLANKLCDLTFADKIFFGNSGTEVVELAIKIARKYHHQQKQNVKNPEIIAFQNSFHGRTIAAISAAGAQKNLEGFTPSLSGFKHAIFNDINSVKELISESTCGILIEPIQGEGGIIPAKNQFLQELRELCNQLDIALIFDEVQTGNGRTGHLYAYQMYNVTPDVLVTAKGLGGGFPIACCMVNNKYAESMTVGTHGSTFGGNPLATKVGLAVINEISQPYFLNDILEKGEYFKSLIQKLASQYPEKINSFDIAGLMLGVKFNQNFDANNIAYKLLDSGLITGSAGNNTLRFLPPLNVKKSEIDIACDIFNNVLKCL